VSRVTHQGLSMQVNRLYNINRGYVHPTKRRDAQTPLRPFARGIHSVILVPSFEASASCTGFHDRIAILILCIFPALA
jgi:hypothetical protein